MRRDPIPGLYETLLTDELTSFVRESAVAFDARTTPLVAAEAPSVLARHVARIVEDLLESLPSSEDRTVRQVALVNEIVAHLRARLPDSFAESKARVAVPAGELLALWKKGLVVEPPPRPPIRLSDSALLVNGHDEPRIGAALKAEIRSADRIDLVCAFVRWSGLRLVEPELRAFCAAGGRLRVLTTTYLGATEPRALERLRDLGAEIRVSYDGETTRLHAKAWLFHRESGFSTAYVGSSNLSQAAMVDGLEWNVRVSGVELPEIVRQVEVAFETYWSSADFVEFDADRFARAVHDQAGDHGDRGGDGDDRDVLAGFVIEPWPHQQRILEALDAERELHGRWRNLVVAATGTGKTLVAAFDYQRVRKRWGQDASLLFVAHRAEILRQSRRAFREVLRDPAFGELWVAGDRPASGHHCFASIQTLANVDLARIAADAFDIVVVDEVHRSAAPTYVRLLEHLRPKLLLGLTATPERADELSILDWFEGRIAAELRLWEALERQLLCPFHYFGVADGEDLSQIGWTRGGYDPAGLERVFVLSRERAMRRVRLIVDTIRAKVEDATGIRALGFCVSVAHARFMAEQFNAAGIPAVAVTGESRSIDRQQAVLDLREGRIAAILSVDVFNEGVDIPEVDTVLFLRPTESATVFLQQLGRGLRRSAGKACLTVLDFVSGPDRRFRFDLRYRALLGGSRADLLHNASRGFAFVPPGCAIDLDREAYAIVLRSVREALGQGMAPLVEAVREAGPGVDLAVFLQAAEVDLRDLYRKRRIEGAGTWITWTVLRRLAGFDVPAPGPEESRLAAGLARMLHVDDPERLSLWREVLSMDAPPPTLSLAEAGVRRTRLLAMLTFLLFGPRDAETDLTASLARVWAEPALRSEVLGLLDVLEERADRLTRPLGLYDDVPLHVHGEYSRDEILAAYGLISPGKHSAQQAGVRWDEAHRTDLLFVTVEKSEADYSPKTRYRDFPLSPTIFHWQSQHTTGAESATGRRYREHRERGSHVVLFVRQRNQDDRGIAWAYTCLGPAEYVAHEGERPMSVTWRLVVPMPAAMFEEGRRAA